MCMKKYSKNSDMNEVHSKYDVRYDIRKVIFRGNET
jgi:hypothetical protein